MSSDPPPTPPFLYHAGSGEILGNAIQTSVNKTVAGVEGKFVFACADEAIAYAYSMKQHWSVVDIPRMLMCTAFNHVPCVFLEGRRLLPRLPPGKIYIVPSDTFERVLWPDGRPSDEFVSAVDIPLGLSRIIGGITPEEVMKKNVQILFVEDEALLGGKLGRFIGSRSRGGETPAEEDHNIITGLKKLITEGRLYHYNAERAINPYSQLLS